MRILVTGASGAGTTTLGLHLADRLDAAFFDADDYFWLPSAPPFRYRRSPGVRRLLLLADLERAGKAVVSGSVDGWGWAIEDSFSLIVFLNLASSIRVERLRTREQEVYGRVDPEFLQWAAQYEQDTWKGAADPGTRSGYPNEPVGSCAWTATSP